MQKMKTQMKTLLAGAIASMALAGNAQANIEFVFDYGYDSNSVMTEQMKGVLEQAASLIESRIADDLGAIAPHDGFAPNIFFTPPDTGASASAVNTIGANQIHVYVGGRSMGEGVEHLALSGAARLAIRPAGMPANDPANVAYVNEIKSRGQAGVLDSPATDYAPWGGSLAFNSDTDFYVDDDVSTTESFAGQYDFYTVALRGLLGILGYGVGGSGATPPSYAALVDGENLEFVGSNAMAEYGGGVPVYYDPETEGVDDRFLDNGVLSSVDGEAQLALMTMHIGSNERRLITELDYAVLQDMGWQVAAVPEPAEYAMFLAGLGLVGMMARRRRR